MKPYPAYKDSGVEWIGEVPEGWKIRRIKHVAEVNREALSEKTDPDYEFYYVDIGNVSLGKISDSIEKIKFENAPSRARRIVKEGDTIVSTVRTYLKAITMVDLDEENLIASTGFAVLSPKKINQKYFSYLMTCEKVIDTICAMSVGVSYPAVNASDIANISIWYPEDKAEQTAIAAYLDRKTVQIDTLIEQKRRLIELLQEERTALISQAVTKGLAGLKIDWRSLQDCASLPPGYKDSGIEWIGAVPEHWTSGIKLQWVATDQRHSFVNGPFGSDLLTSELTDSGVPVIYIRDLRLEGYTRKSTVFVTTQKAKQLDFCRVDPKDILIAKVGDPPGTAVVYPSTEPSGIVTQDVIRIKPNLEIILPEYLVYVFNSRYGQILIDAISVISTRTRVSLGDFKSIRLVLPPLPEQTTLAAYLDQKTAQIDQTIARTERQIELLQEYRTALISAVVTGKVDVRGE